MQSWFQSVPCLQRAQGQRMFNGPKMAKTGNWCGKMWKDGKKMKTWERHNVKTKICCWKRILHVLNMSFCGFRMHFSGKFPSCTSKSCRQSMSSIPVPVNEYPKSLEIKELATPIDRDSEYFWMPIVYLMFIDFEATNSFCQPCAAFFILQVKIPI